MEFLFIFFLFITAFGSIGYLFFGVLFKEDSRQYHNAVKNNKNKYSYGNLKEWLLKF